jgi:hypothetical protein
MQTKRESLIFERADKRRSFNCALIRVFSKQKGNYAFQSFLLVPQVYRYCFYSLFWVVFGLLIVPDVKGQEVTNKKDESKVLMVQEKYDRLAESLQAGIITNTSLAGDSVGHIADALEHTVRLRIDSLTALGFATDSLLLSLQKTLDSPQKIEALFAFQKRLHADIKQRAIGMDTLQHLQSVLKEKSNIINELAADAGLPPTGKDLTARLPVTSSDYHLPSIRNVNTKIPEVTLGLPRIKPGLPKEILKPDISGMKSSALTEGVTKKVSSVTDVVKDGGDIMEKADGYKDDIEKVRDEGLMKSEKLDELAERQALNIDQLKAFKEQNKGIDEMEAYKKLIEQYKDEKRIEEEMKAKVKELANDVVLKNSTKIDASMQKIARIKRKFSDVPDVRNLPRRPPNPMKGLSLRERLVPGLTFQTVNNKKVWLEFDPQIFYKLNATLSAGAGGMYRFSMNPEEFTFHNFGSMSGAKVFVQYTAFKGFFLRGEGQYVRWKPWHWSATDPAYIDRPYVAAIGVGKSYMLAKRIKGSMQTLYHWHFRGLDPYRPKVMIRLGFDFSLEKRKPRPWAEKLKSLRKQK